ncbi:MAG: hypothetical protein NTZ78_03315 [Candidatus Aureabacteria bacterium]|nr:hypothetical protein [Candidatus Auribacterota bacterium]
MNRFSALFPKEIIPFLKVAGVASLLLCGCSLWPKQKEGGKSGASVSKSQKFSVQGSASFMDKGKEEPTVSQSERFRLEGKPGSNVSRSEKLMLERVGN